MAVIAKPNKSPTVASSYRLMSILFQLSKAVDRIIKITIDEFLEVKNLIINEQLNSSSLELAIPQ